MNNIKSTRKLTTIVFTDIVGFTKSIAPLLNKRKTAETGTIWTMDLEGGSPKQLTNSSLGYAKCPSWSPDGLNLVFHRYF